MRIAPGLHSLGDKSGGEVRAFLIDDGKELTLIDTLLDRDGKGVLDELNQMGKSRRTLHASFSRTRINPTWEAWPP
jgi:hypothetical protein